MDAASNPWGTSQQQFLCGCEITGVLWTRSCRYHKLLSKQLKHGTVMACILLGKTPDELDSYEDQLIITEAYARYRPDSPAALGQGPRTDRTSLSLREQRSAGDDPSP